MHYSAKVLIQGAIKLVWDCVVIETNKNHQLRAPHVILPSNLFRDVDVLPAPKWLKVLDAHAYAVVDNVWTEQLVVLPVWTNSSTVDLVGI